MSNPYTRSSWRSLIAMFAVVIALVLGLASSVVWGGGQWAPKLGLDLEGGTQMILAPQMGEGQSPNEQQLEQAVDIMRARVDGQGVSEAEVATLGNNVVVAVPGEMTQEQEEALRQSSQMRFRPVLAAVPTEEQQVPEGEFPPGEEGTRPEGEEIPEGETPEGEEQPVDPEATQTAPEASPAPAEETPAPEPTETNNAVAPSALQRDAAPMTPTPPTPPADEAEETAPAETEPATEPTEAAEEESPDLLRVPQTEEVAPGLSRITEAERNDPQRLIEYATSEAWLQNPEYLQQVIELDCAAAPVHDPTTEDADLPIAACDREAPVKYLLGPAVIDGDQLADATSGPRTNPQTGQPMPGYEVRLTVDETAREPYRVFSTYMVGLEQPRNQLATVLDNQVVSAPYFSSPIPDGNASISGDFDSDTARMLADTLKFGALPISFAVQSSEQISPTVGGEQLQLGIIAGIIGLVLVVVYFLVQYRLLGLVTTFSLLLVALVTLVMISLFGWYYNLRLTMAGVTGAIIAIGTTADSFIVYFERVRDEVREGRSVPSAVQHGWARARRTILISGAVNFLAALVLYMLAASNVRGFAFMLMLTTAIDLFVTFFFTYPMLMLLTRTRFFGDGHRWSGLSPETLGVDRTRYVGRGRFVRGHRPTGTDDPGDPDDPGRPDGDTVGPDGQPVHRQSVSTGARTSEGEVRS